MAVSTPKLQHVSEAVVQPFLQPDFDPADYLNNALPPLSISSTTITGRSVPLSDLSSQLQTLLSQLNAQTSRLSSTLTQLADEIIRSGSRLAYEVEVLRGETSGLADAFDNGLKSEIEVFVPPKQAVEEIQADEGREGAKADATENEDKDMPEPQFLERLRTLTTVRERLESVIETFGTAMQWPVAPSELSLASSLISVSGPDTNDDARSREEKGKEHSEKLRSEVNDLLASGAEGLDAANTRVDELRALAEIWKGTAEEKARNKLVDSLQKLVDDRQRVTGRNTEDGGRKDGSLSLRGHDYRYGNSANLKATPEAGSGYGFLQNLRNLKNEMYQE